MKKFIGLVGANSDESTNRQLLQCMSKRYKGWAAIELVEIKHLPLFNKPADYTVMPEVQVIADKIAAADGVIIATPEHDQAPTAVLNNALAWLSYKVYPFVDKPVLIVGASHGRLGSSRAQIQLQQLFEAPELKAHVMPSSEYLLSYSLDAFDENGNLIYEDKVNELDQLFENFLQYVDGIKQIPRATVMNKETTERYIWDSKQRRQDFKMKLMGLVGSNGEQSFNRLLLEFIEKEFADLFDLEILEIKDVPIFNPSDDDDDPECIQRLSQKISAADGVIMATPEHNRTVTPALKNVIEWLSFKTHPFVDQPVLIVGASYYDQGTSRAQSHLRQILKSSGVEAFVFPGNEFLLGNAPSAFDENGNIKDDDTVRFLKEVLEDFVDYVDIFKGSGENKSEPLKADSFNKNKQLEQAMKKIVAAKDDRYVELNRGILTVDQINYLLRAMPFEVNYIDQDNQTLFQINKIPKTATAGTKQTIANALQHLRSGNMESFRINVPSDKPGAFLMQHFKTIRDKNGKLLGINKHVRDIQPIIDWYLEETGQELVDDVSAEAAVDAVSGATESL